MIRRVGPVQSVTRAQARHARHDDLLEAARAYVARLETGRDAATELRALGGAAVAWRSAERAAEGAPRIGRPPEDPEP